jgi:hypothetical protein
MLLAGWQGKWVDYAPTDPNMISGEMSPPTLEGQQKQRGKWATGRSELMRDYSPDGCAHRCRGTIAWIC